MFQTAACNQLVVPSSTKSPTSTPATDVPPPGMHVCLHQGFAVQGPLPNRTWQQLSAQLATRAQVCSTAPIPLTVITCRAFPQRHTGNPNMLSTHAQPHSSLAPTNPYSHRRQTAVATAPACKRFTAVAGKHACCRHQQILTPTKRHHKTTWPGQPTYIGKNTNTCWPQPGIGSCKHRFESMAFCQSSFGHMPLLD